MLQRAFIYLFFFQYHYFDAKMHVGEFFLTNSTHLFDFGLLINYRSRDI